MKIAMVGEKDAIYPFKPLGIEIYPVVNGKDAYESVKSLVKGEYGLIFVSEKFYVHLGELIEEVAVKPYPGIIPIPGSGGSIGIALEQLRETIKKAVGVDIGKE